MYKCFALYFYITYIMLETWSCDIHPSNWTQWHIGCQIPPTLQLGSELKYFKYTI